MAPTLQRPATTAAAPAAVGRGAGSTSDRRAATPRCVPTDPGGNGSQLSLRCHPWVGGRIPRDRRPTPVASTLRILLLLAGHVGVDQAQFLAGIQERGAAEGQQQDGSRPCDAFTSAVALAMPGLVVIGQHPGRPGIDGIEGGLRGTDLPVPVLGVPRAVEGDEVEAQVQFVAVAVVARHPMRVEQVHLTDRHRLLRILVEHRRGSPAGDRGRPARRCRRSPARARRGGRGAPPAWR